MGVGQVWLHCAGLKNLRIKFDSLNTHYMLLWWNGIHTDLKSQGLKQRLRVQLSSGVQYTLMVELGRHTTLRKWHEVIVVCEFEPH